MQKRELRRAVFGDESCIGRLPWLNTAVLVYVGVTVVSFVPVSYTHLKGFGPGKWPCLRCCCLR